jgi:NADH-quinone oxidoreductase subunit H
MRRLGDRRHQCRRLYLFAISSLGVYGIIMAGWASNSKYAFLGALRSAAQMVSYEVSIGFVIITVLLCAGSLNLTDHRASAGGTCWFCILAAAVPMFVIFFISALAETNRPPFDLPKANPSWSPASWSNIRLDELRAVLPRRIRQHDPDVRDDHDPVPRRLAAAVPLAPFTWIPGPIWFALKICVCLFFMFAMVRRFVPRYRYDQLMRLGWKVFLPFSLFWVVLTAAC